MIDGAGEQAGTAALGALRTPEAQARALIDGQLERAGWHVCDRKDIDLYNQRGNAVREVVMKPDHDRVDYLLYLDRKVVGVIEAKPVGTPLAGVQWQSAMYATGLPEAYRFKRFPYDELVARDKKNLDILWLKDDSIEDAADLPAPEVLAREIIEELQSALAEFEAIAEALGESAQ